MLLPKSKDRGERTLIATQITRNIVDQKPVEKTEKTDQKRGLFQSAREMLNLMNLMEMLLVFGGFFIFAIIFIACFVLVQPVAVPYAKGTVAEKRYFNHFWARWKNPTCSCDIVRIYTQRITTLLVPGR